MSLRKLIGPVFIAVFISILAFVWVTFSIARTQDQTAQAAQAKTILEQFSKWHRSAATLAEDNTWWDQAVEHVVFKEDLAWIEVNLGQSVVGISEIDGVIVLRPDGSIIYSKTLNGLPSAETILKEGKLPAINAGMDIAKINAPSTVSGFFTVGEILYGFGASAIVEAGDQPLSQPFPNKRTPAVFFVSRLDDARLQLEAKQIAVQNIAFRTGQGKDALASIAVFNNLGAKLGYFQWLPTKPGTETLKAMLPASLLVLAALLALLTVFYRRASGVIEQLKAEDAAKSQFFAAMSHEIRTPLNAVLGFSELVSSEAYGKVEGEQNKEYLQIINESGRHLLEILNDILDIAKLDAGRYATDLDEVEAEPEIKRAITMLEAVAAQRKIRIRDLIEPDLIRSDERILRQVLLNILANAVKFEPDGGLILVKGYSEDGRYIVSISDNGPGMTAEEIKRALSLYGQVDAHRSCNQSGTGLGLPLVTRFMKLLGGEFNIQSKPGTGTHVTMSFPLSQVEMEGAYNRPKEDLQSTTIH